MNAFLSLDHFITKRKKKTSRPIEFTQHNVHRLLIIAKTAV